MWSTVFLVTGPAASGKTAVQLARYRAVAASGVGAAVWLAPTERARVALRHQLVSAGEAVLAPNLFTFPEFAREIVRAAEPAARPLQEIHQRLLLDDVLAKAVRAGDVPDLAPAAGS